jgi:hypothetical protein
MLALAVFGASRLADEYTPGGRHPVRILAYVLHPVGVA